MGWQALGAELLPSSVLFMLLLQRAQVDGLKTSPAPSLTTWLSLIFCSTRSQVSKSERKVNGTERLSFKSTTFSKAFSKYCRVVLMSSEEYMSTVLEKFLYVL